MSINVKRAVRVADQLQRELATMLQAGRIKDPRLHSITITGVKLTDDLRLARVYYVLRGDEQAKADALKGLQSAKGFLRREIGQIMKLKYSPDFQFFYDGSFDYAERIETLLHQIKKDEID